MIRDDVAAGFFEVGYRVGVLRLPDIIAWTDRQIVERDQPQKWLIDVAMSHDWHPLDIQSRLREIRADASPESLFKVALTVADLGPRTTLLARDLSRQLYRFALDVFELDWTWPMLSRASHLREGFNLIADGYTDEVPVTAEFWSFIDENSQPGVAEALSPVRWHVE